MYISLYYSYIVATVIAMPSAVMSFPLRRTSVHAYETAKNLLLANYDKFTALTWQLMNTTVVTRDQIEW